MGLKKLWYKAIKIASALAGWGFAIVGAVIVFQQVAGWLKYAIWQPHSIGDALLDWGLPLPYTPEMLGVQKIIDEILSWPAFVAYIVLAIGCTFVFVWAEGKLNEIESKERNAQREKEKAEREKEAMEIAREEAAKSKVDFDFELQIEEILGKKRERF